MRTEEEIRSKLSRLRIIYPMQPDVEMPSKAVDELMLGLLGWVLGEVESGVYYCPKHRILVRSNCPECLKEVSDGD